MTGLNNAKRVTVSKPTDDHVSAIARVAAGIVRPGTTREAICRILNSDDPNIHAAMIAALVGHGALVDEENWCVTPTGNATRHRLVGPWDESAEWRYCGLGPCIARDGHEGTCEEASWGGE